MPTHALRDAQREVPIVFIGGFWGQRVSSAIRLASAALRYRVNPRTAFLHGRRGLGTLTWAFATVGWSATATPTGLKPKIDQSRMHAVFHLENHQTGYIKLGSSRIVAVSAWVTHVSNPMLGRSEGLEIRFFTRPITAAARTDIIEHDAKELKTHDFVTLLLFLDKGKKVEQVNMSYVIPGTTVARTVASTPDELAKEFSNFQFSGKRLRLKSKGTFNESNDKRESLKLSWDVDINLPVFDRAAK